MCSESKMQALISVIVPIYNTKEYLDICIDSIVKQTYTNLEIILVDDGSTDGSGEICDLWKKKDKRIKVLHKENGGQAQARNVGIAAATGDFIGFVDSDDFIAPEMYMTLLQIMEKHQAEIVGCDFIRFSERPFGGFPAKEGVERVFDRFGAVENLIVGKNFGNTVPNLLLVSKIAKSVLFDEGKIHEDIMWPYRAFRSANCIVHTSKQLYAYYQRPGSTMNSGYSAKRLDALDALQLRAKEVYIDFPSLYPRAERLYIWSCMCHYQSLCCMEKSEANRKLKRILHERFMNGDRKSAFADISFKYKIWYAMFARMPDLTCRIRSRLKIGL